MKGYNPAVADVDNAGVETRSDNDSWSFARQLFEKRFARFVAAVFRPLYFEHRPLDLVRFALKLLDRVSNLLISEIGLLNLDQGQALRLLHDRSGHDVCSPDRLTKRVAREPVIAPMMKATMNPTVPAKR